MQRTTAKQTLGKLVETLKEPEELRIPPFDYVDPFLKNSVSDLKPFSSPWVKL